MIALTFVAPWRVYSAQTDISIFLFCTDIILNAASLFSKNGQKHGTQIVISEGRLYPRHPRHWSDSLGCRHSHYWQHRGPTVFADEVVFTVLQLDIQSSWYIINDVCPRKRGGRLQCAHKFGGKDGKKKENRGRMCLVTKHLMIILLDMLGQIR